MKITCFTESVSQLGGGLFDAERRLQQSVMRLENELEVDVLGMWDVRSEEDRDQWNPVSTATVRTARFPPGLGYSSGFEQHLSQQNPELVYCIGLWKYFSKSCLNWYKKTGRPYMIAPHGMLDPWAMRNHKMRKKLLMLLYQRSHLSNAACIRALNTAELKAIRGLGFKNPVCVIPNGVDLPEIPDDKQPTGDRPTILFLGRLHPKKGVEVLLDSWQQFVAHSGRDYMLKIVGWGDSSYVEKLKQLIKTENLGTSVEMTGPLFGKEKHDAFLQASAFILPSFSEGMPMTVLEAWSYEIPVIMTPQCNIPEGTQNSASISCQPEVTSVLEAMEQFGNMNAGDLQTMGRNGRRLVEREFTWEVVGSKMASVYYWLTGKSDRPDWISHAKIP